MTTTAINQLCRTIWILPVIHQTLLNFCLFQVVCLICKLENSLEHGPQFLKYCNSRRENHTYWNNTKQYIINNDCLNEQKMVHNMSLTPIVFEYDESN